MADYPDDGCSCELQSGSGEAEQHSLCFPGERNVRCPEEPPPGQGRRLTAIGNRSPSGCSINFVDRPSVGERHWVKFEGMDALEGEVRWVENFNAGLKFIRPIHPAVFELLLTKLR